MHAKNTLHLTHLLSFDLTFWYPPIRTPTPPSHPTITPHHHTPALSCFFQVICSCVRIKRPTPNLPLLLWPNLLVPCTPPSHPTITALHSYFFQVICLCACIKHPTPILPLLLWPNLLVPTPHPLPPPSFIFFRLYVLCVHKTPHSLHTSFSLA